MTKKSLNSTRYLYIYIPMKDDLYSLVVSGISYLGMPDLTFLTFCCNVFLLFSVQHTVKGQCHTNRIRNTHHGSINADTFSASHSSKLCYDTVWEMSFYISFALIAFPQYTRGHSQNIMQDQIKLQADP